MDLYRFVDPYEPAKHHEMRQALSRCLSINLESSFQILAI